MKEENRLQKAARTFPPKERAETPGNPGKVGPSVVSIQNGIRRQNMGIGGAIPREVQGEVRRLSLKRTNEGSSFREGGKKRKGKTVKLSTPSGKVKLPKYSLRH